MSNPAANQSQYEARAELKVALPIIEFAEQTAADRGLDIGEFWAGASAIVHDLAPKNAALLAERDRLQQKIDDWHRANPGPIKDMRAYQIGRAHV